MSRRAGYTFSHSQRDDERNEESVLKVMSNGRGLELKIPPLVVLAIAALAMWLIARAMPRWIVPFPGRIALAVLLAMLGICGTFAGVLAFNKASTTVNPHLPENSSNVVTNGIYRFTRNPMYLGMLLVLFGWAIYLAHVVAAMIPFLFAAYITRYQIQPEERVLIAKFGAPYEAYLKAVRRWV